MSQSGHATFNSITGTISRPPNSTSIKRGVGKTARRKTMATFVPKVAVNISVSGSGWIYKAGVLFVRVPPFIYILFMHGVSNYNKLSLQ